jgi:replicative DNA helicase
VSDQRPEPVDHAAEAALLGALLWDADAVDDVAAKVAVDDLTHEPHRIVYRALLAARAAGEPTDARAVTHRLAAAGKLTKTVGDLLADLTVDAAGDARHWAAQVAEAAFRRTLVRLGQRIANLGYAGRRDADDNLLARVYDLVAALDDDGGRDDETASWWRDMLTPGLDALERAADGTDAEAAVPTGLVDLDRLLGGGLRDGQLVIVAGRTSVGKTVVAMDIARHAAMTLNLTAAVFTLEMSRNEIFNRNVSALAQVPLHAIDSGKMADDDWARIARVCGTTENAPLWVDEAPNLTVADIRARARRLHRSHNLRLIVVDYLQLVGAAKGIDNRQQQVADMSRGLKLLGKELGIPVVVVAQLNRGPENRADKRPVLADLRESGAIENDANVVILIHRDDYYDPESPRKGEADLIVAKNRNGPRDTVTVAAQLHFARMVSMALPTFEQQAAERAAGAA